MTRFARAVALAWVLMLPGAATSHASDPPPVDGVYALPDYRLVRINNRKLDIVRDSRELGRQRVSGQGYLFGRPGPLPDHVVAYLRSRRTMSSNGSRLRPPTCQSPVIPGFASSKRRRCQMS